MKRSAYFMDDDIRAKNSLECFCHRHSDVSLNKWH